MIAPTAEAEPTDPLLLDLLRAGAARYPSFVGELRDASGEDPGLYESGALAVARDRDEAEALDRERAVRERFGLHVERLLPREARRREPALAPGIRLALAMPDDQAIDPHAMLRALRAAFERAGGEVHEGVAVERIEDVGARHVVVAAGAWTGVIGGLPENVPVRPVKGQVLRLRDPSGPGLVTRVIRGEGVYLVPRGDGRYVLGATMEERGFDTSITAGPLHGLLRDAIELVPGIEELEIETVIAGLRPMTPDGRPLLGPASRPGVHWATGHGRNGILLTPLSGDIVLAGILGEPLPDVAEAARPDRFTRAEALTP
jgi:glycine oxidase